MFLKIDLVIFLATSMPNFKL